MPARSPGRGGMRLLVGVVIGIILAAVLAVVVLVPLALTRHQAAGLETAYGAAMVARAADMAPPRATPTPLPPGATPLPTLIPPTDQRVFTNQGRNAYTGLCAGCHGVNGDGKGTLVSTAFPPPADLTAAEARARSDDQMKAIIRHGLGFTGMPAFESQLDDDKIAAIVGYIRQLQQGQPDPIAVPTPNADQLALADPKGDAVHRGAALFLTEGCAGCHGPANDAPDELQLQDISALMQTLREGRPGMPVFSPERLSDKDVEDILAYLNSLPPPEEE